MIAAFMALGFAVLSFVSLSFKFVSLTSKAGGASSVESGSLSEWGDLLDGSEMYEKMFNCNFGLWKFSHALMFIAVVVIAVVAILAFVQLFVEHKALALATKITGIVSIVLTAAFIACFVIGGGLASFSQTMSGVTNSVTFLPHVGPILLTLFGILSAVFALISNKKRKI